MFRSTKAKQLYATDVFHKDTGKVCCEKVPGWSATKSGVVRRQMCTFFFVCVGVHFFRFSLQNTDQRTTDFKYLTSKDQELSREIEVKIRKIERLQSSLQHWRTKVRRKPHLRHNGAASRRAFTFCFLLKTTVFYCRSVNLVICVIQPYGTAPPRT